MYIQKIYFTLTVVKKKPRVGINSNFFYIQKEWPVFEFAYYTIRQYII